MSITSDMRAAWAPACTGPFAKIYLHGEGAITVRATAAPAFHALNACLVKWNYRTRQADTGAYNCRKITGGTLYSLHAYGIAADLNWQSNPYGPRLITDMPLGMIEDIEALRTNSGHRVFRWGGRYVNNKDAMHFEVICTPGQLATGIKNAPSGTATSPTVPRYATLRLGNSGPAVRVVQTIIRDKAGGGIVVDGIFGPTTKSRVMDVQRFFNLAVDGVVGTKTWEALLFLSSLPAPSSFGDWPTRRKPEIKRGSSGDVVRYLQDVVAKKAGGGLAVDGMFGAATESRVKDVQRIFKLRTDGIVGPKTWGVIDFLATT